MNMSILSQKVATGQTTWEKGEKKGEGGKKSLEVVDVFSWW